jgi:tRNA(Ile)-lysidine synthase
MNLAGELEGLFLRFLKERLDPSGSGGLLVGLSGGCDSTALLFLCIATADRHGRPVAAGHVNHGIRPDADTEEDRLRTLCSALGVPLAVDRIRFAGSTPSEAEMRRKRLKALRRIGIAGACPHILLGHQRDDQVETVILNLTRGAGLRGLAGIPPVRGPFVHPLLEVPRAKLRRYLEEKGVSWSEDPMNLDPAYARNRIRQSIVPLLEAEVRHGASSAIARASFHLRRALEAIEGEARRCIEASSIPAPDGEVRLDGDRLRKSHVGLIDFALRLAVQSISGTTENVSTPVWRMIVATIVEGRSGRFPLPGRAVIEVTERVVRVAVEIPVPTDEAAIPVPWNGRTAWRLGVLETRLARMPEGGSLLRIRGLTRIQVFDASSLSPPVRIRLPRAGDRIALEDVPGRKHLSDLLSEKGIARSRRLGQPVLEDDRGILWAPGIRRAGVAHVGPETTKIWIARWFGPLPADHGLHGGSSRS